MSEIDFLISTSYGPGRYDMSYEELEMFDDQVLDIENPQLQRYLMNGEPLLEEHAEMHYINALVDYVELRKTNYAAAVPNYAH